MSGVGKTDLGHQVIKDRSVALTPRQRSALILFDGHRTFEQVLQATAAAGVTSQDVDRLLELGLITNARPAEARGQQEEAAAEPAERRSSRSPQERYAKAYPIATALTAGLGLRGLRLNLAVEAAAGYEQLLAIAPRICDAVGASRFKPLEEALADR